MKKLVSKIVLSAIIILSYPGKIFANTANITEGRTGGTTSITIIEPTSPTLIIVSYVERIMMGWVLLSLGVLMVICYSMYFFFKKEKKIKKYYLYIANVALLIIIAIFVARCVFWLFGIG